MLTRLEVKGFKNLLDMQVDFGPFTCIAGANGIGKSNIFDAIEFLSSRQPTPWSRPHKELEEPPVPAAEIHEIYFGTDTATINVRSKSLQK